jgi:hypothetical protein
VPLGDLRAISQWEREPCVEIIAPSVSAEYNSSGEFEHNKLNLNLHAAFAHMSIMRNECDDA